MGSVNFGIPLDRVLALAEEYGITDFVEGGTYKGGSCSLAAQHFKRVITIEGDRNRFEKTTAALAGQYPNLTFWYGDTRTLLAKALKEMDAPCLLWLDAHFCGGGVEYAHRIGDECPLSFELQAINSSKFAGQHVILIDDARYFVDKPPAPHDPSQWLTYTEIQALLRPRIVSVKDDVIYAEPPLVERP